MMRTMCNVEEAMSLVSWMDKNKILPDCAIIRYFNDDRSEDPHGYSSDTVIFYENSQFRPAALIMDAIASAAAERDMLISEFIVDDIRISDILDKDVRLNKVSLVIDIASRK